MTAMIDRTAKDAAPALLAWHAEETNRLLKDALTTFFDILAALAEANGQDVVGACFCPFLDDLQQAGDSFDHLYHAATGKANA